MQPDLKNISSAGLVERLRKNTQYFMLLCKTGADAGQRKVAKEYIDLIIAEMKTRDGYEDIFKNEINNSPQDNAAC
jgi:hypothetical protein